MNYFLGASPILLLLLLLTVFKWSGKSSGLISWLFSIIIASLFFGLSSKVFWVSQAKGVVFSIYVLLVLWSALLLYNLNNQIGGINSVTQWLKLRIPDRSLLVILIAWSFSGILEGIAGFGLPIAVAAPMLAGLGVPPLLSVVASAIGHTWSVTLGNMGMVFQVLTSISGIEETALYPPTAVLMGLACLLCGSCSCDRSGRIQEMERGSLDWTGHGCSTIRTRSYRINPPFCIRCCCDRAVSRNNYQPQENTTRRDFIFPKTIDRNIDKLWFINRNDGSHLC